MILIPYSFLLMQTEFTYLLIWDCACRSL